MKEAYQILQQARRMVAGVSFGDGFDMKEAFRLASMVNAMIHGEREVIGYQAGGAPEFGLVDTINDDGMFDWMSGLHEDYLRSCGVVAARNMYQIWVQLEQDNEHYPQMTRLISLIDVYAATEIETKNIDTAEQKLELAEYEPNWPSPDGGKLYTVEYEVQRYQEDPIPDNYDDWLTWSKGQYTVLADSDEEARSTAITWYTNYVGYGENKDWGGEHRMLARIVHAR